MERENVSLRLYPDVINILSQLIWRFLYNSSLLFPKIDSSLDMRNVAEMQAIHNKFTYEESMAGAGRPLFFGR